MLGHPSVYCWLLWFLCFCSMFHLYLWCFFLWGFWDFFARTFTSLFGFRWGGDLLLLLFFRKWFCLGAFSTQHRLCSLRLLASNVGRPGYSEFVQLVLKRAAQEQIKNRRHATGSALKFGSKVALILFQVQTVPWGVVKFHCVGSHAFLWGALLLWIACNFICSSGFCWSWPVETGVWYGQNHRSLSPVKLVERSTWWHWLLGSEDKGCLWDQYENGKHPAAGDMGELRSIAAGERRQLWSLQALLTTLFVSKQRVGCRSEPLRTRNWG